MIYLPSVTERQALCPILSLGFEKEEQTLNRNIPLREIFLEHSR